MLKQSAGDELLLAVRKVNHGASYPLATGCQGNDEGHEVFSAVPYGTESSCLIHPRIVLGYTQPELSKVADWSIELS